MSRRSTGAWIVALFLDSTSLIHVVRVRLHLTGMLFSSQIKPCKSRQIAVSERTAPPTPDQAGSADGGHCSSHPGFRYVERECGLRPSSDQQAKSCLNWPAHFDVKARMRGTPPLHRTPHGQGELQNGGAPC